MGTQKTIHGRRFSSGRIVFVDSGLGKGDSAKSCWKYYLRKSDCHQAVWAALIHYMKDAIGYDLASSSEHLRFRLRNQCRYAGAQ